MTLALTPGEYWRLRYLQALTETVELRAKWDVAKAQAVYADALRAVGASPTTRYEWSDPDTTLREVAP